jgi:hypothetical protein
LFHQSTVRDAGAGGAVGGTGAGSH